MTGTEIRYESKKKIAIISAISLTLIALIAILGIWLSGYLKDKDFENELRDYQSEMLEALQLREGEYDEQSIVLYGTNKREANDLAELFGAKLRITENGEFATLTLPDGTTIVDIFSNEDYLEYFNKMSADWSAKISDAEEEYERLPERPDYTVSDELYAYQNYLDYLNLGSVWHSYNGSGVTVAVIDTGIDTDHPEFAGRISEYSYNASEDKIVKDYVLENGSYDWSLIEDEQGHGTAVSGTIGAAMDGNGTVGIAPYVTIIVIKAECDANGNFLRSSDLVFGLYYAIERDVDVVNMSFGGVTNIYADAARLGRDSDVLMVASTGNNGNAMPMYPAADENVIGVGAIADDSWELADYSNYGESVDVVAPGTVYTTAMGGEYKTIQGTSFSSPIVAATLALMKCNWSYRYSTNEKIIEILYASSYDLGDLGPDYYYGYGALDVEALLIGNQGTVTFDYLTDEIEETTQVFISGNPLQNIPEPERLYAVFEGWYYDIECTEPLDLYRDAFRSDLTLYAKWVNEDDGVPFTYVVLDDGTIEICSYTGHRKYITVPEIIDNRIVSSIGDFAFAGQNKLREVELPDTITHIGISAFEGCSNLVSMNIPDSVIEIESGAFRNNIRLGYVNIGSQSSLKIVGDFAFEGCSKLKTIDLQKDLEYINGSAFYGATSMIKINVDNENENFVSASGVLFNKSKTNLIAYPAGLTADYTIPNITRSIGAYAFAFSGCSSIELSSIEVIGSSAFAYSSLERVIIPDSVTSLGAYAFSNCYNLSDVTIGTGLTNIAIAAFSGDFALNNVYIPANVITIESKAFAGAGLQDVEFAENSQLLTIGDLAFAQTGIRNIAFPKSLVSIGNRAFEKCYWLSAVSFEEGSSLQAIGGRAFVLTVSLKEISFPETLRVIGDYAFDNSGLTGTITIPKNLEYFGAGAFASCHGVTAFEVEGGAYYKDIDGVVYTVYGKTLVAYPAGNATPSYTVVSGTEIIGASAFEGSNNLQHVTVCEGVTSIEEYAFYKCGKVYGYSLPSTLREINAYAFSENSSLQSVSIPKNVITIGRYAFAYDYNLGTITIPDDTEMARIGFATFAYTGITNFKVPANISTIAQYAFEGCSNLQTVTFAKNSKLESISAYMFKGAENIYSITFESGSALTSIQAHGFEGMRNLQSVNFGDAKLTNIDNYAFRYCSSLTTLNLPETVENIGRFAFYKCTSLSELIIPAKTEHIGSYAFYGTNNCNLYFTSDSLPLYLDENWDNSLAGYYTGVTDVITDGDWKYGVKSNGNIAIIEYLGTETVIDLNSLGFGNIETIGGYAFASSDVTSVILPETIIEIQRYAFAYTKGLTSIEIPENVRYIASHAFLNSGIESLVFTGDSVEVIERYAFAFTDNLTSVEIPASVSSLGSYAFYQSGIESLTFEEGFSMIEIPESAFASTNITSIFIPDSVTRIHSSAFRDNVNLKSVTIGSGEDLRIDANAFYNTGIETLYITDNVRYIGEYAFVGLENLKNYVVSENNTNYSSADGVLYSKDQTKLIAFPAGRAGSFEVPDHVENIGFGAFENSHLTSVTFADGINLNTIGWRAFFNAGSLTEIIIPESVISIDFYAFAGCKNLTTVMFLDNNKLKGIYEGAFFGCQRLENITIPDSIVEISEYAFYGCMSLDHLPVSEASNLKGIFDYAFAYTGITDLKIPESVIDIGNYAFCGSLLEKVYIPDTNAETLVIGIGAFADCNYLEEITLPFIGASFEDETITWFGYIFGAGGYEANSTYVPESLKTVNIHDGITKIPEYAFYGLSHIEEISVPHSVMHVGRYAFSGTEAKYELTNSISVDNSIVDNGDFGKGISGKLTLAEGVTTIGSDAFSDCASIESIDLSNSVTSIGSYAFLNCTSLESIVILEGVTSIERGTFGGCKSLKSIKIPDSVTTIGSYAFSDCTSLESIVIPDSVTNIDDYAFRFCTSIKSIEIPDSVIRIGGYAFQGCTSLKSIVIPDSVTSIGDYAFSGFTYLEIIVIPDSVTSIGDYAFSGCSYLESIVIPDSVTSIGCSAFSDCSSLKSIEIPEGVTCIDNLTFRNCTALNSIVIPDSVTSIGDDAFDNCPSLARIVNNSSLVFTFGSSEYGRIAEYAMVIEDEYGEKMYRDDIYIETEEGFIFEYENGEYTLIMYIGTEDTVTLPENINGSPYEIYEFRGAKHVIIPGGATNIGYNAFHGCKSLKSIEIPDSVVSIGDAAFYGCTSLESIIIPDSVTSIGGFAFSHCTSLESIVIPDSVTSISESTFDYCTSLESIVIPDSVTSIGFSAFVYCGSLKSIEIPDSVTGIGSSSFHGCTSLESIVIPDSVTSIGGFAFSHCTSLESIVISDSVTSISESTFYYCTSLKSVEIPEGVIRIEYGAFSDCSSLTRINIPNSLEYLDVAFSNTAISQIEINDDHEHFILYDKVLYSSDYSKVLCVLQGAKSVVLPNNMTVMPESFFAGIETLESVIIPDSVTSIGSSAFSNCTSLKSIVIPDSVTSIGDYAFYGCTSLESIDIPNSVTSISKSAFDACTSLESIEIPDSVASIGDAAFSGCTSLESIIIPDSVTNIGGFAFSHCTSLESIIIPDSVTSIGSSAFSHCTSLESIVIPDSVTSIASYAFHYCTSLESIEIPDSVTSIGDYAFSGCTNLTKIVNNSSLVFTFGSAEYGYIAEHAEIIENANGEKIYRKDTYIETEEGFVFEYKDGEYTLIMYTGLEDTVTLPKSVNGCSYEIYVFRGAKHVIIPEGVTSISNSAFDACTSLESIEIPNSVTSIGRYAFHYCTSLKSIVIPDSLTSISEGTFSDCTSLESIIIPDSVTSIGGYAFQGCTSLKSIVIPDSVTSIGEQAFNNTAYYDSESNWTDGMLYIGNHLIDANEDSSAIVVSDNTKSIVAGAFSNCYLLEELTICGDYEYLLSDLTNLETLTISSMPTHPIYGYFSYYSVPITLSKVVLKSGCEVNIDSFEGITGVTIFVEDEREACPWDENYPGWNNGNKVVYGGDWHKVNYYNSNGEFISAGYYGKSEVIKPPYVYSTKSGDLTSEFVGWDLDGDGIADSLPATINRNYNLYAVIEEKMASYTVKFMDKDGKIALYTYKLPYGAEISLPEAPSKVGYSFVGWIDLPETVTKDIKIYSQWIHDGGGHDYTLEVIAPSCTSDGYTLHSCTICGEIYKTDKVPATGHSYGEWVIDAEPTCHSDGSKYRECSCGEVQTIIIDSDGHNYAVKSETKPSCTRVGSVTYRCNDCGAETTEELPLTSHVFEKKYASKSWLRWLIETLLNIIFGYEGDKAYYYQCKDCKHIATSEESNQLGGVGTMSTCQHQLGDWVEVLAPSCIDGYKVRYCTLCNEAVEAVVVDAMLGHVESEIVIENNVKPTCTIDGSYDNVIYCETCENELSRETVIVDAIGHALNYHDGQSPTCTDIGWHSYEDCSHCDYTTYMEISALGHNYSDEWTVDIEPTCTSTGRKSHHCIVCDAKTDVTTISRKDHEYGEWTIRMEATCERSGYMVASCKGCGRNVRETIEALGHDCTDKWYTEDPECTRSGSVYQLCLRCGDKVNATEIPALGHDFGAWEVVFAPTCTSTGTERRYCSRCHVFESRDIDTIAHTFENYVSNNDATCTANGTETAKCDRCDETDTRVSIGSAIGHVSGSIVVENNMDPTCINDGSYDNVIYCTVCDEELSRETITIDALGHDYQPTWSSNSTSHWYECSCGEKRNVEKHVFDNACDVDCNKCGYTRTTKHSFGPGEITKEPTTTEEGIKTYTCTVCGEKKYEDIDKLDEPDQEPSGGCYIATSVYGSYDCPEVWTLRRFRDNVLAKTWLGRAFVKTYYAVSPTLVEWFGETNWFQNIWRAILDVFVNILNEFGFENTPYHDQKW